MSSLEKLPDKILRGTSDANIPFEDLCQLLNTLGFSMRVKGDHHIFTKDGINEILNLQPKGSQAKPYQVKQVRKVIIDYHLTLGGDNEEQIRDYNVLE
jgi:predicted RNA binding protein YcfA (HicA-like mRNA interferase family)